MTEPLANPIEPTCPTRRLTVAWLLAPLLLALLLRSGALYAWRDNLERDPDGYRQLADNLWQQGTYGFGSPAMPTAFRPPLYPLALVPCVATGRPGVAIAGLHLVCGLLTVWLTALAAAELRLTTRGALFAALLVACDPLLIYHGSLPMTETLAALLTIGGLLALIRAGRLPSVSAAALAGGVWGAAALCRPPLLLVPLVATPLLIATSARHGGGRRWGAGAALLGAALLLLAPWVVRNEVRLGRPIVTTTHGGYTLHLANNGSFYRYVREAEWGAVWDPGDAGLDVLPPPASGLSGPQRELATDRLHYRAALATIAADPAGFLRAAILRAGRLWQLAPHAVGPTDTPRGRRARWSVGLWYALVLAAAAAGAWRLGRRLTAPPWLWVVLPLALLTLVHAIYWSNMRMRAPLMPLVALLAAAAVGLSPGARQTDRNV